MGLVDSDDITNPPSNSIPNRRTSDSSGGNNSSSKNVIALAREISKDQKTAVNALSFGLDPRKF
jgi:hypothetical protein